MCHPCCVEGNYIPGYFLCCPTSQIFFVYVDFEWVNYHIKPDPYWEEWKSWPILDQRPCMQVEYNCIYHVLSFTPRFNCILGFLIIIFQWEDIFDVWNKRFAWNENWAEYQENFCKVDNHYVSFISKCLNYNNRKSMFTIFSLYSLDHYNNVLFYVTIFCSYFAPPKVV